MHVRRGARRGGEAARAIEAALCVRPQARVALPLRAMSESAGEEIRDEPVAWKGQRMTWSAERSYQAEAIAASAAA